MTICTRCVDKLDQPGLLAYLIAEQERLQFSQLQLSLPLAFAYGLVGLVQLALRHDRLAQFAHAETIGRAFCKSAADYLQHEAPFTAESIRRGSNPAFDVAAAADPPDNPGG